jgi:N-acetylneuraminate synthase
MSDVNLRAMQSIRSKFGVDVGYSDHTVGIEISLAAVALGARVIEKHFTLDRKGGGPDDSFSLEPAELAALCKDSKTACAALGCVDYGRKSSEQGNAKFRRSLYFVQNLKAGDVITPDAVRSIRPGYGLSPKHLDRLLGKTLKCDAMAATPVKQEMIQ